MYAQAYYLGSKQTTPHNHAAKFMGATAALCQYLQVYVCVSLEARCGYQSCGLQS